LLAIGLAVLTASVLSVLGVLVLTALLTGLWALRIPTDLTELPLLLVVMVGFALFFFVVGVLFGRRFLDRAGEQGSFIGEADRELLMGLGIDLSGFSSAKWQAQVPALAAVMPFLLLIMISLRLPLPSPTPLFAIGLLLTVLLLGYGLASRFDLLVPVNLACVLALEYLWHEDHFQAGQPWTPLLWYAGFYALFTLFPFLFQRRLEKRILPWACSALAGPSHCFLFYRAISMAFPNSIMGLLPAALAVPMLLGLARVARGISSQTPMRLALLAWYGGSALFFLTLIIPIQFRHQWITVGWAMEGLALIWLFHRVPHPGLRATGVVLLGITFVRLALNPAVLDYHRSSATPLFNWYLYAYGIVTVCLMVGARLLAPPRHLVWKQNVLPLLYSLGTVLAFLLVNIEIADYFAEGTTLTFQFSGNFARDMSYSMAWALFGLILLVVGIWKRLVPVRYAAIGLLSVTLGKLFLHDLSQLSQLYRIGAFLVVAVILILASFLYQRFVSFNVANEKAKA
jgi:uncharacterized membrane protein